MIKGKPKWFKSHLINRRPINHEFAEEYALHELMLDRVLFQLNRLLGRDIVACELDKLNALGVTRLLEPISRLQ